MQAPVKICGIRSLKDAKIAFKYGASAIGLIFFKDSKRYICPSSAAEWIGSLEPHFKKVGVFVDEEIDIVNSLSDKLGLDFIQLHGNESAAYCNLVKKPVIKAFRVHEKFNPSILDGYKVEAFLFDNYKKNELGGTGEVFDWNLISNIKISTPIILSGGLNVINVMNSIEKISPAAIDLNSGVESSPGVKDEGKISEIFKKIRLAKWSDNFFKRNF